MIITILNDGEMIMKINTHLLKCVQCNQYSPYTINYPHRHYGWRLCALHLNNEMRNIIRDYSLGRRFIIGI